jgi:hypothetical protein
MALYHVSRFAKELGEPGPATGEDRGSLPRNRLKIQHIATEYQGQDRSADQLSFYC